MYATADNRDASGAAAGDTGNATAACGNGQNACAHGQCRGFVQTSPIHIEHSQAGAFQIKRDLLDGGVAGRRRDHWRFVDVGDGDGDRLGGHAAQSVGHLYGDVVDVVGAGVGRYFIVGRGVEGEHAASVDAELACIGPADDAVDRCAAVYVCAGDGGHRGLVLGSADRGGAGDHRRVVYRRNGDGDAGAVGLQSPESGVAVVVHVQREGSAGAGRVSVVDIAHRAGGVSVK